MNYGAARRFIPSVFLFVATAMLSPRGDIVDGTRAGSRPVDLI
jgi:hypothetical protein